MFKSMLQLGLIEFYALSRSSRKQSKTPQKQKQTNYTRNKQKTQTTPKTNQNTEQ